jgi:DNA polymerase I
VFLNNPSKKQIKELIEFSEKVLDLDLEYEKTYQMLALSERKKNYIGIHKDTKKIEMKGLTAKKRNTPEFIKKTMKRVFKMLTTITNQEEFNNERKHIIDAIKIVNRNINKFELKDYSVTVTLSTDPEKYKVKAQQIKAIKNADKINDYAKGDMVTYVKTRTGSAQLLECAKKRDLNFKQYKKLLRSTAEQLLDALGINWREILGYENYYEKDKTITNINKWM